jgi:rhamnose transport system substrate-binding protein
VFVTGLGLPPNSPDMWRKGTSRLRDLESDRSRLLHRQARREAGPRRGRGAGQDGAIGRVGKVEFDANGEGAMADPFVYNKANVAEFAKIF